jgi:hypothetical protein
MNGLTGLSGANAKIMHLSILLAQALKLLPNHCEVCYHPATYRFQVRVGGSGDAPRDSIYCDQHCPKHFKLKEYELPQADLVRECIKLAEREQ